MRRFHEAAEALAYDIGLLGQRFGASFEQVCHRLTTLQRPTARGVPFFMLRVDHAGNVSKRFSSGTFPFSKFGGTCPLWNVHATFDTPGKIVTQIIELPDGTRYFSIAQTVRRPVGAASRSRSRATRSGSAASSNTPRGWSIRRASTSRPRRRRRSASIAGCANASIAASAPSRRSPAR